MAHQSESQVVTISDPHVSEANPVMPNSTEEPEPKDFVLSSSLLETVKNLNVIQIQRKFPLTRRLYVFTS